MTRCDMAHLGDTASEALVDGIMYWWICFELSTLVLFIVHRQARDQSLFIRPVDTCSIGFVRLGVSGSNINSGFQHNRLVAC